MLLRCALEVQSDTSSRECVRSAARMIRQFRKLKDESQWDLADNCLEQCEELVDSMSDDAYLQLRRHAVHGYSHHGQEPAPHLECDAGDSDSSLCQDGNLTGYMVSDGEGELASYDMMGEGMLPVMYCTGPDYGVFEGAQGGWNHAWQMPVPDPWLVPGLDESGNFNL